MSEGALTQNKLRELLDYSAETGAFTWKVKRGNRGVGGVAGGLDGKKYTRIKIDKVDYRAHRLAWLYVHGVWPKDQIDHIDMDRTNNAIVNLREADNSQNNANRAVQANNTSGVKGVRFDRQKQRWRAELKINGKYKFLGRFKEREKAAQAYQRAAKDAFGAFARI